jgi:hypothetical protein
MSIHTDSNNHTKIAEAGQRVPVTGVLLGVTAALLYTVAMDVTPAPDPTSITQSGRALAAQRRTEPGSCVVCGASFVGLLAKRTCSGKCRIRLHRLRQHVDDQHAMEATR